MSIVKERGLRKVREGVVIADAMDKTRVVQVKRRVQHPMYKKVITKSKSYYMHDEKNETHKGDKVRIIETRPLSKLKRWRLMDIIKKS